VMSLTPMAPSAWRYYVEEIARGREDYYAYSAEQAGRFMGRGAEALGLSGMEADALALERLFGHGVDPCHGSPLGRSFEDSRAVAGFALTFSPPKTVSVLWALADVEAANEVAAAHDAAVATALDFVDEHASFTRRGHNGLLQVDTDGLIAAGFVHRTSRAADPQLHTHLLVANKVRAEDGKWLSLDARELFETQKAAGMLYKAALRAELSGRLGVAFTAVDENGVAEIAGVPKLLVEKWSARRHELKAVGDGLIAKREVELGRILSANERAECFQIAAYRTRTPKIDADTPTDELRAQWASEADAWGLGPEGWLGGVIGSNRRRAMLPPEKAGAEVILRLEEHSATWGRADVVEEVTRIVMGADAEVTRGQVESLTDRVLRHAEVVSLAGPLPAEAPASLRRKDGMATVERHGAVRFSTRTTLRREAAILEAVADGKDAHAGVVSEEIAERVLSSSRLGNDQREAVRGLLLGGEEVALLVGPAGTGKSRSLDAARLAWEEAGYDPIGLAPSAMAACVLSEEAGLRTDTLAKFLLESERAGLRLRLDHRSVVVLDETGMARSDDLAKLIDVVQQAKAKLVLAGDPHQLGAVGPGGIFRTLVSDHGAHELETVRRFEHAWEAAASLRLRACDPAILSVYLGHDRIGDGSRAQMIDEAFSAWRDAREAGSSILLMAGDNATADELSRRCRSALVQKGWIAPDGVRIATGVAGYGDEIVTLRNDRRLRSERGDFVRNGARWQVIGTSMDGSIRVASSEDGVTVTLPPDYVREHVALAYALTVHKAQGQTTERAIVLVDNHMTAAQFYVAMSRGRQENRALVVSSDDAPEDHVKRPSIKAVELLTRVMRHDEVDRSAHDEMRRSLARYEDIGLLKDLYKEALCRITEAAGPDRRKEIAALEPLANPNEATTHVREAEAMIHLAEERRAQAEARAAEAGREPMRVRLPGRLGVEARERSNLDRVKAGWALEEARRAERQSLRDHEEACKRLYEAEEAVKVITALRDAEARRLSWMDAHPDEVRWARDLRERIDARTFKEGRFARADRGIAREVMPGNGRPSRLPRARQPDAASAEPRNSPSLDPAIAAVLARVRTAPPKSPLAPPRRERPVLER
jgi:conjugative relaxase-like TrwC/TraI family protein